MHLVAASSEIDAPSAKMLRERMLDHILPLYERCSRVIKECLHGRLRKDQVKARIRSAQFFALYVLMAQKRSAAPGNIGESDASFIEQGRRTAEKSLDRCDELCKKIPDTMGLLKGQVQQARNLLEGAIIYTAVSAEEKRLIHQAMSAEFSSTGRWYTCSNGHPVIVTLVTDTIRTKDY